jgi:FkbM family methyltransferase
MTLDPPVSPMSDPAWLRQTPWYTLLGRIACSPDGVAPGEVATEALPAVVDEAARLGIVVPPDDANSLLCFAALIDVHAGRATAELLSADGQCLDYVELPTRREPFVILLLAPSQPGVFFHLRHDTQGADATLRDHAVRRLPCSGLHLDQLAAVPQLARHDTWPANAWGRPAPDDVAGRLRELAFSRLAAPLPLPWLDGIRVLIEPDDEQSRCLATFGFYEAESMFALSRILRPGDVFVDVGANAGIYTLFAAAAVGPTGRVIACEPSPREQARLRANLALNDFPQVDVITMALGEAPGTATLRLAERYLAGHNSMFLTPPGPVEEASIAVTTLDRILASSPRCDCVKIDVEGAELLALRGATETLARCRPKLLIEFNPDTLAAAGTSAAEIAGWLGARGYRLFEIDPKTGETAPARLVPPGPSRNLLALPLGG